MMKEPRKEPTAWIHGSHLTDNKLLSDSINNVTVDIEKDKDWSISDHKETRQITRPGQEYLKQITTMIYSNKKLDGIGQTLKMPMTKDGEEYSIDSLVPEQKTVVLAVIHTIINFLRNVKRYVPIGQLLPGVERQGSPILLIPIGNH
jgi:hypothetical protein